MRDGTIVATGTPSEVGGRGAAPTEIRFALPEHARLDDLPPLDGSVELHDGEVLVVARDGVAAAHRISGWALARGFELRGFAVAQPSLEDVYLRLTATEKEGIAS